MAASPPGRGQSSIYSGHRIQMEIEQMTGIKEVGDKIYRLQVVIPRTVFTCTVYFIKAARGVIIDPGPASTIPEVMAAMKDIGMKDLEYIIPTHIHLDHAGGTSNLAEAFPVARVILHPSAKEHMLDTARLVESTRKAYGEGFEKSYGTFLPVPESHIDTPQDGEALPLKDRPLRVVYSPGHALHHISILDMASEGLFCGEALGMRAKTAGSMPMPCAAPPAFDIDVYLETIKKLGDLKAKTLFYAHDGVGRNPEELISAVRDNTWIFGNMILNAMKSGQDHRFIRSILEDYFHSELGIDPKEMGDYDTSARGFEVYFKRRGMV